MSGRNKSARKRVKRMAAVTKLVATNGDNKDSKHDIPPIPSSSSRYLHITQEASQMHILNQYGWCWQHIQGDDQVHQLSAFPLTSSCADANDDDNGDDDDDEKTSSSPIAATNRHGLQAIVHLNPHPPTVNISRHELMHDDATGMSFRQRTCHLLISYQFELNW
jgi:hypothetical protein